MPIYNLSFERIWVVALAATVVMPFIVEYCVRRRPHLSLRLVLLLVTVSALVIAFVRPDLGNFGVISFSESWRQGRAVTRTGFMIEHPDLTLLLVALVCSSSFAWAIHARHLERRREVEATERQAD